jgi:hypothetical protein
MSSLEVGVWSSADKSASGTSVQSHNTVRQWELDFGVVELLRLQSTSLSSRDCFNGNNLNVSKSGSVLTSHIRVWQEFC